MDDKLDLTALLCGETDRVDFEIEFQIDPSDAPYGVVFPDPVRAKGTVSNYGGYMQLCSEESVHYISECSRCLSEIDDTLLISFEKNVAVAGKIENEETDDYLFIENSHLDVKSPLLEQVILEFPSKLLCKKDCKGLCQHCGADLNKEICKCSERKPDSPFALALAKFRAQMDEQ